MSTSQSSVKAIIARHKAEYAAAADLRRSAINAQDRAAHIERNCGRGIDRIESFTRAFARGKFRACIGDVAINTATMLWVKLGVSPYSSIYRELIRVYKWAGESVQL